MEAPAFLFALHRWIRAHTWPTVAICVAVFAATGAVAARIQVEGNVAALLPGGPGSPGEAAQLLSEFGALDTLLLDLSMEGASVEELVSQGEQLSAQLAASGLFKELYAGPAQGEVMRLGELLLPRRLYLLDAPEETLRARLKPEALERSLSSLKAALSSPAALAMKRQLLSDPLGLNQPFFAKLSAQGGALRVERGRLLSQDGKHLLMVATPRHKALDVDASQALMRSLAQVEASLRAQTGGRARLQWAGGPRFAAESAALVRQDVADNFLYSTAVLLAVFLLRFRGLRLLLLASLPLAFGVVGGIAAMALLKGTLHGLTLGFGSALIGIAMDYPLHLINSAAAEPGERGHAYEHTTAAVFRGLCLGFFTTAMGFAALLLSDFPALQELAQFSFIGLVLAFAANFLVVPPLCARLGPQRQLASGAAVSLLRYALPPRVALGVTLVLLALGAFFARGLRFDGDLRKLDSQNPRTLAEHDEVLARFGRSSASSLVVSTGPTLEAALALNDRVAAALAPLEARGALTGVTSVASLVPSVATQRQRAERLAGVDLAQARAQLSAAAAEAGFSATAFDGFWEEVAQVRSGELEPLEPRELEGTSLGLLLSRAVRCVEGSCRVVTTLARSPGTTLEALRAALPVEAQLVDSEALAARTVAKIPQQLALLCLVGVVGNLVLLSFIYRSVRHAVLACLPCAIALVLTVGLLALLDAPLNLVSGGGLVLVFGCGVDYGIFSLEGLSEAQPDGVEQLGVLLAAFTTLAGFGTLAIAQNGAMRSLGLSTALGTAISAAVALLLLPGLAKAWLHRRAS